MMMVWVSEQGERRCRRRAYDGLIVGAKMDGVVAHRNGVGEVRRNLSFKGLKDQILNLHR